MIHTQSSAPPSQQTDLIMPRPMRAEVKKKLKMLLKYDPQNDHILQSRFQHQYADIQNAEIQAQEKNTNKKESTTEEGKAANEYVLTNEKSKDVVVLKGILDEQNTSVSILKDEQCEDTDILNEDSTNDLLYVHPSEEEKKDKKKSYNTLMKSNELTAN